MEGWSYAQERSNYRQAKLLAQPSTDFVAYQDLGFTDRKSSSAQASTNFRLDSWRVADAAANKENGTCICLTFLVTGRPLTRHKQ